jgi:hypothetical protein
MIHGLYSNLFFYLLSTKNKRLELLCHNHKTSKIKFYFKNFFLNRCRVTVAAEVEALVVVAGVPAKDDVDEIGLRIAPAKRRRIGLGRRTPIHEQGIGR